nr:uroporphyrinogen decarboxylase [Candidatus Sigynarchaeota archaeon]
RIIAPGCDMPYDVPLENVIGVDQAIHEPGSVRTMLENYKVVSKVENVQLPDYDNLKKPLVEVFTIDSAQCAACGYMKNLAMTANAHYRGEVDIVEYKSIELGNIKRAQLLGIKHLPCIFINGKLKYSSIIPSQADYFKEIDLCLKKGKKTSK